MRHAFVGPGPDVVVRHAFISSGPDVVVRHEFVGSGPDVVSFPFHSDLTRAAIWRKGRVNTWRS